jgi:hypothetical protein
MVTKMRGINPSDIVFSKHCIRQIKEKNFNPCAVIAAITYPDRITEVRRYPGQKRYIGAGLAVVMRDNVAITVYLDGVVTPLREDQKNDPAALNSVRLNRK